MKQTVEWHFTHIDLKVTVSHAIVILFILKCQLYFKSISHPLFRNTSVISIQYLSSNLYSNMCRTLLEQILQVYIRTSVFVSLETIQYSTKTTDFCCRCLSSNIYWKISTKRVMIENPLPRVNYWNQWIKYEKIWDIRGSL